MITVITPQHQFEYAGAAVNVFHANKGEGLPRHQHEYSHATLCTAGSCIVRKENVEKILSLASGPVNLRENEWHEIEALEDGSVFINIFAKGK